MPSLVETENEVVKEDVKDSGKTPPKTKRKAEKIQVRYEFKYWFHWLVSPLFRTLAFFSSLRPNMTANFNNLKHS